MEFSHTTVLLNEAVESLNIKPDGIYIDGTAGGGGHSAKILEKLTNGKLISIDRDPDAIEVVKKRFENNPCSVVVKSNYSDLKNVANSLGFLKVNGVLLDLGVSSWQFDCAERGFSYHKEAPLDMRMSKEGVSAYDLVNTYTAEQLSRIFAEYGEEKFAYKIAKLIEKKRTLEPIKTTTQLADIISAAYPAAAKRDAHPARKVFQALRIAVNGEIEALKPSLESAFDLLENGGRLAVITFHSIEDRIVKQCMNEWTKGCICPKDFPICVCGRTPAAKLVYKHPVIPSDEEIEQNNRSRSAKLRACEKLHDRY
ncbi:MAG: 16S rRNA (cytosine(1402)-N(4))-methyltransferase RsmH [Clostridiales bacterium]|nr:16S rRNA (cytosine(1402)-N(4))-methyltransferase RsmH [Clostridiales bacterium]